MFLLLLLRLSMHDAVAVLIAVVVARSSLYILGSTSSRVLVPFSTNLLVLFSSSK